jgi:surface antigen
MNKHKYGLLCVMFSLVMALPCWAQITGISGSSGSQKFYYYDAPSGLSKLEIKIAGGTGDCDLYVKYGSQPSTSSYNYRPYLSGNNETVTVNNPSSGRWHIMLRGYSAYSGVTLSVTTWTSASRVATPTFSPSGGTFTGPKSVTMSCGTSGATIRYTTNGNTPTSSSTKYTGAITVDKTTTIKAKAFKSGMTDSYTATATYTINAPSVSTLSNGQTVSGLSGSSGSEKFYKIVVPSGQSKLEVKIWGGSGDCDVYVRLGAQPTTTSYDIRPYLNGNNETATKINPAAGTWYIMLRGYSSYSGLSLMATYSATATVFPETVIKSKTSTSPYATTQNPFSWSGHAGQCTWYSYGRVKELAAAGYLPSAASTRIQSALGNAAQWPQQLGGNWYSTSKTTPLQSARRKNGLLAVYPGPGANGHVGFVEEVSSDKKKFRMSEFNRLATEQYSSTWYYYDYNDGTDSSLGCSSCGTQRYYPSFYDIGNPTW